MKVSIDHLLRERGLVDMSNDDVSTSSCSNAPPLPHGGGVDFFEDCREFSKLYCEKTGTVPLGRVNKEFIIKMVKDELEELDEAKDEAEEVDALLDAVYYIFDHLAKTGLDIKPIWKLIHKANMTKFGPGGYKREDGKWMKPAMFAPPDDDIRKEIERQRSIV